MKKLIDVDEGKWKRFEELAVVKFGLYGAIKKGIKEAIELWIEIDTGKKEEGSSNYMKVLNALEYLKEVRLLAADIQGRSDVTILIDPLLNELYDKASKATMHLEDIDWEKIKEDREDEGR